MKEIKRYERGYDKGEKASEGVWRFPGRNVHLADSELLLAVDEFSQEAFEKHFATKTGEWWTEDGWVVGRNPDMCPGMIVSKEDFFGEIMFEITTKLVPPSTHDINVMINGEFGKERGNAYVAGIEAFWQGNIGFEKSPGYKLTAATNLFDFDPDKEHVLQFGNAAGLLFVRVDGNICLMVTDPDPIDVNKYGKVGVEAFSSWLKFRNMKIYRLKTEKVKEYYCPEF